MHLSGQGALRPSSRQRRVKQGQEGDQVFALGGNKKRCNKLNMKRKKKTLLFLICRVIFLDITQDDPACRDPVLLVKH